MIYNTISGAKLQKLLSQHGNFQAVETCIKKSTMNEELERLRGGWHTEVSLQKENWTELLDLNYTCI